MEAVKLGSYDPYVAVVGSLASRASTPRADGCERRLSSDVVYQAHDFVRGQSDSDVPSTEVERYTLFAGVIAHTATHCDTLDARVVRLEADVVVLKKDLAVLMDERRAMLLRCMNQYLEMSLLAVQYGIPLRVLRDEHVSGTQALKKMQGGSEEAPEDHELWAKLQETEPLARVIDTLRPLNKHLKKLRLDGNGAVHRDPADQESDWDSLFEIASAQLGSVVATNVVREFVKARRAAADCKVAEEHPWLSRLPRGLPAVPSASGVAGGAGAKA